MTETITEKDLPKCFSKYGSSPDCLSCSLKDRCFYQTARIERLGQRDYEEDQASILEFVPLILYCARDFLVVWFWVMLWLVAFSLGG